MTTTLLPNERVAATGLAAIFALRMLGLFLILPIFAIYAPNYTGASHLTVGFAIGIYGLTQGLLQFPCGALSDRIGRRKLIVAGLLLFSFGSLIAYFSTSIWGLALGRGLQGAGAIGSTVMALAADLSRPEVRSKMMAIIGSSVGAAFTISLIAGPIAGKYIGLSGIFLFTAVLAVLAIPVLFMLVPAPKKIHSAALTRAELWRVLKTPGLFRLDFGIFCLHAILTALFLVLPLQLQNNFALDHGEQSWYYFCVLLASFVVFIPAFLYVDKKFSKAKQLFTASILLLLALLGMINLTRNFIGLSVSLMLFFVAFNILEALLPAWISKIAPAGNRGAALGCFSTAQFLGIFVGGLIGGIWHNLFGILGLYGFCIAISAIWMLVSRGLVHAPNPEVAVNSI